jgi:hypothetical protein
VGIHDTASDGTGEIRLYDGDNISGDDYVGFKAPDIADGRSYNITLPPNTDIGGVQHSSNSCILLGKTNGNTIPESKWHDVQNLPGFGGEGMVCLGMAYHNPSELSGYYYQAYPNSIGGLNPDPTVPGSQDPGGTGYQNVSNASPTKYVNRGLSTGQTGVNKNGLKVTIPRNYGRISIVANLPSVYGVNGNHRDLRVYLYRAIQGEGQTDGPSTWPSGWTLINQNPHVSGQNKNYLSVGTFEWEAGNNDRQPMTITLHDNSTYSVGAVVYYQVAFLATGGILIMLTEHNTTGNNSGSYITLTAYGGLRA